MVRVAIFVEDRLVQNGAGRVLTGNRRLEAREWESLGPTGQDSVLCARLATEEFSELPHVVRGRVAGLPNFRGVVDGVVKTAAVLKHAYKIARKVDLVVSKCPGMVGTISVLAAKLARKPLAIHFVGDIEDSVSDGRDPNRARFLKGFARELSKCVVRRADAVRYPTREFLQAKYPAAHPEREFWYTDASVSPLPAVPPEPSFVNGRILAIGTQERMYKGHDLLIEAMPSIIARVPEAHLVLVGKGACRAQLVFQAEQLGVRDKVEFVDSLDGWSAVSSMIQSARVFAMPSLAEGLPRALLEAMSLGTACLGSDVSGIPELLPSELMVPRGTVAPLAELVVRLLSDEPARRAAAETCLENSRDFAEELIAPRIADWQERLLVLAGGQ